MASGWTLEVSICGHTVCPSFCTLCPYVCVFVCLFVAFAFMDKVASFLFILPLDTSLATLVLVCQQITQVVFTLGLLQSFPFLFLVTFTTALFAIEACKTKCVRAIRVVITCSTLSRSLSSIHLPGTFRACCMQLDASALTHLSHQSHFTATGLH